MEYEKKIEICAQEMARDFKITEEQAESIIHEFDLDDIVLDYYETYVNEAEEAEEAEAREELRCNYDLYYGDIHGGI